MELLLFSRMFRFMTRLHLERAEAEHPEIFGQIKKIHEGVDLTEDERQTYLLQVAGYVLENCCEEKDIEELEKEISLEWPHLSPNTIMEETILFWCLWRYLSHAQ